MRRAAKRDANERAIIDALESIGCTVEQLDKPVDLLVGRNALNWLLEVKNSDGKNVVTDDQAKFMARWKGQVRIVWTPEDAIRCITESYTEAINPLEGDNNV